MIFDWTINLGNILTIVSFFFATVGIAVSAFYQLKTVQLGVANINARMDKIDEELKKQTEILIQQAAARERMNALERRIDELYDRLHPKVIVNQNQQPQNQ